MYEYMCANEHWQERLYNRFEDSPDERLCECGEIAKRVASRTQFKCAWVPTYVDAKNGWEGTPLEGTDGKNRLTYESDKIQVDLGQKTQISGKTKPVPTKGVGALGR
jgi:hypothetical protein